LKDHDYYHVESGRELENHTWAILYADGSYAEGKVYADKVVVGGVTATSQAVEAATAVSSDFVDDVQTDGLLGLAFNTLNTVQPTPQKTFFDNVLPDLLEPVFAVNLKFHAAGSYDFGYIDEAKYTGEITYVDVDNARGFWIITAGGYSVGQKSQVITEVDLLTDTGTSLTYLPTEIVTAYYAEVPGAQYLRTEGGWIFPCSAALPEFSLIISGVKQTMPGKYANFGPVDIGSPTCFGGIQDGRSMPNILGDTFLKSKYVIHEFKDGKARLGFAQQVGVQTVMGHD
jgi:aspergillopepsin I